MELAEQQIDDPDERERVIAEIEAKDREAKRQAEQKKVEAQKEAERLASERARSSRWSGSRDETSDPARCCAWRSGLR